MRLATAYSLVVLLGACSSNSVSICDEPELGAVLPGGIKEAVDLENALTRLLVGHCRCEFSPLVAEEITFDGRGAEPGFDPAKAECLGRLKVVSAELSLPGFGSVTVEQARATARGERFVIVFVHNGSRWMLYWPAPEKQRI